MMGMTLTVRVIGTEVSTESKDAQHRKVIRVDNHSFKVRAFMLISTVACVL